MFNYLPMLGSRHNGRITDRSGMIAAGNVSQALCPVNAKRSYLLIQNTSSDDLWIDFTVPAVGGSPSVRLPSGANLVMEDGYVATDSLNVVGAITGQTFTAKEA